MSDNEKERRNIGRRDLTTFFPTVFNHQGQDHRALLMNLSSTGGRFQPQNLDQPGDINVDDILDLEIRSDKGLLNLKSKVTWVRKNQSYFSWGANFIDLDDSKLEIIETILKSNS